MGVIIPRLYAKPSKLRNALLQQSKVLKQKYYPPFWCIWGSFHTIIRQYFRTCPQLPFKRDVLKLSDGGQVALDWLEPANSNDDKKAPIVIILPGLTGCTFDGYVLHMAATVSKNGYRAVVFNNRGNGGIELLTPKIYSAAYTDDLKSVVAYVRQCYSESKVMAAGFSLGGMILFNYVSKYRDDECGLKAAMVISSPWNPTDSTKCLEGLINRTLFNYRMTRALCTNLERNRKMFEDVVDIDHVLQSRLIREFDERFIVPAFGYKNLAEYYNDAAFHYKVRRISIPTLCLNSADDCFAPVTSIPLSDVQESDNVLSVITNHGGHIAFMKEELHTISDDGLIEDLFSEFANVVFELL